MPPPKPLALRTRPRLRLFRPYLELLEDRLPPGDIFWSGTWAPGDARQPAPAADAAADPLGLALVGNEEPVLLPFVTPAANPEPETVPAAPPVLPTTSPPAGDPADWLNGPAPAGGRLPGAVPDAVDAGLADAVNSGGGGGGGSILSTVNLSVARVEVTQAIQTLTNAVGLVAGKATMVRLYVGGATTAVGNVWGALYVYQDGARVAGSPFTAYNGPITARPSPNRVNENDTLNFILPSLSGTVHFVPVVYALGDDEVNWDDNFTVTAHYFDCRRAPTIRYLPTDYRPTGGTTPNLPNAGMMAPGTGDAFVRAIYPFPITSNTYAQLPGGPLLWTQNIDQSYNAYFNALNQRRQMTTPTPDFVYGWLPGNPFYGNGAATLNGRVSFGNTEAARFQRTFAHELGHNFGMNHNNDTLGGEVGVDVYNSLGLGPIKPPGRYDIMNAGRFTHEAFVNVASYNHLLNHPLLRCGTAPGATGGGDYLFITGLIDEAGTASLNPVYRLNGPTEFTQPDADGEYVLQVHTSRGAVSELRFDAGTRAGGHEPGCGCATCTGAAFALVVPNEPDVTRVTILRDGRVQDQIVRSAHAPAAGFAGAPAVLRGATALAWGATDADGDALTYSVQYSPDGGKTMVPVAVSETGTQVAVNAEHLPASANGFLRLIVTDGLNTTTVDQPVAVVSSVQ